MYRELSFEETSKYLTAEVRYNQVLRSIVGPNKDKLSYSVEKMVEDIGKKINGEEIKADKKTETIIKKLCSLFLNIYLTQTTEEKEREIIYQFATLSFNWGKALNADSKTMDSINALLVGLNMHNSCIDAINTINMLTSIVQKYLRFDPPAYNISRAYLESIYKELE